MKLKTPQLIALVDDLGQLPFEPSEYGTNPQIKITIARLADDGKPSNWRHEYKEREDSAGGQVARIWAYKPCTGAGPTHGVFSCYGPDISWGDTADYVRAAAGMKRVSAKMTKIYETRGNAVDACDSLGRWFEACGVERVYLRPTGVRDPGWLNQGEWTIEATGTFIERCRRLMPKAPAMAESSEASAA